MTDPDPEDPTAAVAGDLHKLLARGDWACAHDHAAGLAETAHLLALCVAPPDGLEFDEIERLASSELAVARQRWDEVTRRVRATLFVEGSPAWSDH